MLLDFNAMLWDSYVLVWGIEMKGLMVMVWYAIVRYAMRFEQNRPRAQNIYKYFEVKW